MKEFLKKIPRPSLNAIGWILILGFIAFRVAPQAKAAIGLGTARPDAPSYVLQTLDGDLVSDESLRGKVVLVNFWATWCPPCRIEMPGFQRVYEDRKEDGFVIVAISTDRAGVGPVHEFIEDRGLTFPVGMLNMDIVREFGETRALPTSFLIDREGKIRQEVKGIFAEPMLRMAVNRLLEEDTQPDDALQTDASAGGDR